MLDQLSKWLILEHLFKTPQAQASPFLKWLVSSDQRTAFTQIEILPFFNLTMVWNEGMSFGLLGDDSSGIQAIALSALAGIICTALFIWILREKRAGMIVALSMIIAGALGNVLDRLRFGAVADFFDFHIAGWHYPAFNIADSVIVLGVAYLALDALFFHKSS